MEFTNDVHSPFFSKFVMDDIMEQALYNSATRAPGAHRNKILFELEYAGDILCTLETFPKAQSPLDSPIRSVARYRLKPASLKCKLLLID